MTRAAQLEAFVAAIPPLTRDRAQQVALIFLAAKNRTAKAAS